MTRRERATAFGPATVGNAAVGFDILGFATDSVGDRVTVRRIDDPTVEIGEISGVVDELPREASKNTATVGLLKIIEDFELSFGFRVDIEKGIDLGSGMGGSAASAVAAVVAAAALIDREFTASELFGYALAGEAVASGAAHGDNVAPCLLGGLTLIRSLVPMEVIQVPVPSSICCVLVKPEIRVDTREARELIPEAFDLPTIVGQTTNLSGFIAGCYRGDLELIGASLKDILIEPHRAPLIKGFSQVRSEALSAGALGCSISGSGPSVFAWCDGEEDGRKVEEAMIQAFADEGVGARGWTAPVNQRGAYLVDRK